MSNIQRIVYTYRHTLKLADRMINQSSGEAERDNAIACIVFCAFSLEGYLNHSGAELIPDWDELYESLRPKAKLMLISDRYQLGIQLGTPPFQSFTHIFEIRNQLAHPKTRLHNYEKTRKKTWLSIGNRKWPAEKWEANCDFESAEKCLTDTKAIIALLEACLPIGKVPAFILSEHVEKV